METTIDYKKQEILKLIKDVFYEDWMDEEDWDTWLKLLNKAQPNWIDKLLNEMQQEEKNGVSFKTQLNIYSIAIATYYNNTE